MNMSSLLVLDATSREPLFPHILERIGEGGAKSDPFLYVGAENNANATPRDDDAASPARLSKFWMEAHELSCLRRASFQSSVERTYNDAMSTLLDENGSVHLEVVRKTIGGNDACAYITSDGAIINNDATNENRCYRVAFCMRGDNASGKGPSLGCLISVSDPQMETVARLSGMLLLRGAKQRGNATPASDKTAISSQAQSDQASSESAGGWLQYPTSIAQKITGGVSYAIDKVLSAYEGDDDFVANLDETAFGAELDDASSSAAKILLDDDVTSSRDVSLYEYDDEVMARKKGGIAAVTMRNDHTMGNADDLISIAVVVSVCKHLLAFARHRGSSGSDILVLGGHQGDVERVMLNRRGWDACSFGAFCRRAGAHYATKQFDATTTPAEGGKMRRIGKILSDIEEREVDLLASTLCQSNCAIVDKDIITLFPGGVPCNFEPCQSDHALFQIHVTKITIQNRMLRLEQDANVAKGNAVKAQRNNMTQLAMVHMRRRKATLEELERCASIMANLDASELRLDRAKNDVQIVQSYTLLRTALQDIRTTTGIENENVEELMLDLREEMEDVNAIGGEAIYPDVTIDEDELNEEFKLLELECENESKHAEKADEVEKVDPDEQPESAGQSSGDQQKEGDSDASKAEAIPA